MNARRAVFVLLLLVLTAASFRRREFQRWLDDETAAPDRYVDAHVRLHVVVQDPSGAELVPGKPLLRIVDTYYLGAWIDTKSSPPRLMSGSTWAADTECDLGWGQDWYCSQEQADALLHDDPEKLGQLVYGSEGAGKTRALAMWHYIRWLENIGHQREGGQTAPTGKRLEFVRKEMLLLFPESWYRYKISDDVFVMCDGTRIQLVSTYRQSKAQGSPIQGFNWSWCGRDEAQDQIDVHEDIESRGRSAPGGLYWQLATATAKDDSAWRDLRDILIASDAWLKRSLSIFRSPFTSTRFLADKAKTMDVREFRRRYGDPKTGEVSDLLPELAVYFGWDRKRNFVPYPQIATDVTAAVLAGYQSYTRRGARFAIGVGHDPGSIYNTSTIWKLLMLWHEQTRTHVPTWTCVGELQTKQTTAREHAKQLKRKLQDEFFVELADSSKALIFCDPHGRGDTDTDYQTVYMAFQGEGLDVFNPAPMTKRISRSARIGMMNRLMRGTAEKFLDGADENAGVSRLAIAHIGGRSCAPKLVEALETLQKQPGDDNPEGTHKKNEDDKTHAPASAAYFLWPFEQEAATANTVSVALADARRVLG